jgi:hypothetical protein
VYQSSFPSVPETIGVITGGVGSVTKVLKSMSKAVGNTHITPPVYKPGKLLALWWIRPVE